jgi:hypothetical protein
LKIEQNKNYGLLYDLGIMEKNKKPEKVLLPTKIITKMGQKVALKTVLTAEWIYELEVEDDTEEAATYLQNDVDCSVCT